jgi:hypothetical protein
VHGQSFSGSLLCRRGRPALSAAVVIAVLVATGACSSGPLVGTRPAAAPTSTARSTTSVWIPTGIEVVDLLRRRAEALVAGDEAGFAATVADRSTGPGERQLAAYRAARSLRLARFTHGAVTTTPDPDRRSVRAEVEVRYRLDHLDTADRTTRVAYELVRSGGAWAVSAEGPVGTAPAPPWLAMPGLRVVRTPHAVVAGTVPESRLEEHAAVVDGALPALMTSWDGAPRTVLVLAPGTPTEAHTLLGRPAGAGDSGVAATTEGPTGPDGRATGDRIVLDPTADARLTPAGRDVVLTHELVHVAVRGSVPGRAALWLAEGYADHVGYTRSDVPSERLLEPLLAEVRAGRGPTKLPSAGELDPSTSDIEVPYLAAWQAVELLVQRHGEDAVRRLIVASSSTGTAAQAEAATDRALESVLRTTRADLTRDWRARLEDLAG